MVGYEFKCRDVGLNCGFEFKNAISRDEAMELAATHAKVAHGMAMIPADVAGRISAAVKSR